MRETQEKGVQRAAREAEERGAEALGRQRAAFESQLAAVRSEYEAQLAGLRAKLQAAGVVLDDGPSGTEGGHSLEQSTLSSRAAQLSVCGHDTATAHGAGGFVPARGHEAVDTAARLRKGRASTPHTRD